MIAVTGLMPVCGCAADCAASDAACLAKVAPSAYSAGGGAPGPY